MDSKSHTTAPYSSYADGSKFRSGQYTSKLQRLAENCFAFNRGPIHSTPVRFDTDVPTVRDTIIKSAVNPVKRKTDIEYMALQIHLSRKISCEPN